jgi:hypothetical protein
VKHLRDIGAVGSELTELNDSVLMHSGYSSVGTQSDVKVAIRLWLNTCSEVKLDDREMNDIDFKRGEDGLFVVVVVENTYI